MVSSSSSISSSPVSQELVMAQGPKEEQSVKLSFTKGTDLAHCGVGCLCFCNVFSPHYPLMVGRGHSSVVKHLVYMQMFSDPNPPVSH